MNVCIISMTNLFLCPYIKKYLTELPADSKVDLIYWNRHGIQEDTSMFNKTCVFSNRINERNGRFLKLKRFVKFKHFCIKEIENGHYDRIIILHNYLAVLMGRYLKKNYKGKYLIDIRDYSYEHNPVFAFMEKCSIQNSGMAVISSEGFKYFLPEWKYTVCHNDPQIEGSEYPNNANHVKGNPIKISFIGLVRFYEQNKKLMNILGNDKRFILGYYGQNSDVLQSYAIKNGIENVRFRGRFDQQETMKLFLDADIINNYYGNHTPVLDYALSNKLYYAALLHKPILVCEDTYMEELSLRYSFGICFDENKDDADSLFKKYESIDKVKLKEGCELFLKKVDEDNRIFSRDLASFMSAGKQIMA